MLFMTYWFAAYICILFPLYWFIPYRGPRLIILLVGSAVFHSHFAGPAGVVPVIVMGSIVFLIGLTRNKSLCAAGIVLSALSLIYYKYTRFICISILQMTLPDVKIAPSSPSSGTGSWLSPIPPLAISFFVFEYIHYLVEIYRGGKPIRNIRDFALFSIFWPSIVAGPVKRYREFLGSMKSGVRNVNSTDVSVGMTRLGIGLVKKFAADTITAWTNHAAPGFENLDLLWRWFFLICLALRIVLDFSGYSDMAIGMARMHGIRLPENFNWPYLATNLTIFWHRWHMSLSLWIRDYIYLALGGGRSGVARKVSNGLLAFAICGLWHGSAWNFLVWGLYHGVGLSIAGNYRKLFGRVGEAIAVRLAHYPVVGWAMTMLFVMIGWLFFFYPVKVAWNMLLLLFGETPTSISF